MKDQREHGSGVVFLWVIQIAVALPALAIIVFNIRSAPWIAVIAGLAVLVGVGVFHWRGRPETAPGTGVRAARPRRRRWVLVTTALVALTAITLIGIATVAIFATRSGMDGGVWTIQPDTTKLIITPESTGFSEDVFRVSQDSPSLASQKGAGLRRSSPIEKTVPSEGAGLFLRQVPISPSGSRTATLTVVVRGMPRDRFYEALNATDLTKHQYLGREEVHWEVPASDDGIAFGYVWPDGAQYVREPLGTFFGMDSMNQVLFALIFMALAAALSPGVGPMLWGFAKDRWRAAAKASAPDTSEERDAGE